MEHLTEKNTFEQLQEEYGKDRVKKVDIANEEGTKVLKEVLIIAPDREAYCKYLTFIDKDILRANNALLSACVKSHTKEIKADDELFMAASQACASLIKIGTYKIKNG